MTKKSSNTTFARSQQKGNNRPHKRKVALFGPVAPWRGGIAQYTTQLHKALAERDDVEVQTISFKHLYPKLLYPGKSETEPKSGAFEQEGVEYLLDIYSPLSWRKAAPKLPQTAAT